MIPNNKLTSSYVEGDFLFDNYEEDLRYLHPGGADLNNISEKYDYQNWEMYYEDNIIKLKSLTNEKRYNIKTVPNVKELSFSFSYNMDLTYSYVVDDLTYLIYYDTLTQSNKEETFTGMAYPKLVYDDTRETQTSASDVLLVYINTTANTLCYRAQRDRYTKEYILGNIPKHSRLVRVGMANNYRLKFKLQGY